jgi:hypothetical protein
MMRPVFEIAKVADVDTNHNARRAAGKGISLPRGSEKYWRVIVQISIIPR